MASIYKKPVVLTDPKTGKRVKTKSKKWWGRFKDEHRREIRDRRNNDDRLAHLSAQNPAIDRRRVRRPLSPDEFARLLDATQQGPSIQSLSGPDRVIVYILACYTGFRRNEIGSVTMHSFNFESDPPTLTVEAGYSKRRRTDVMPLRTDLAQRIQDWITTKRKLDPTKPLVKITSTRTAEMLKKDLARAAWLKESLNDQERQRREQSSFLTYQNDQGQFADFHALRKTFITNLSRAGVSPKTAQLLARHSDINLTMNTYTMLGVLDQVAAVEALPPIPESLKTSNRGDALTQRVPA